MSVFAELLVGFSVAKDANNFDDVIVVISKVEMEAIVGEPFAKKILS